MNSVFYALVASSFLVACWAEWVNPDAKTMALVSEAALQGATGAVTLALGLIGTMALFLGLMKIAEKAGLLGLLARLLRPLMVRLFPDIPADHPAMGAMALNISANMIGLSNAATPFGIRAMQELDRLNPNKGTATNAMVLFMAINTANVTLLPTSVLALRASLSAKDPGLVIPTTLIATLGSTLLAILMAKYCARFFPILPAADPTPPHESLLEQVSDDPTPISDKPFPKLFSYGLLAALIVMIPAMLLWGNVISPYIIPALILGILTLGMARKVAVYEAFIEGAKDGIAVSFRIIPYLVAILMAVSMFRQSGAMALFIEPIGQVTGLFGLPAEAVTMAIMRSLSGSGSYGYLASLLQDPNIGPDSYLGLLVSTIYASSETTFYVLAVYFGAIGVKRIRHALLAGITADIGATLFAVAICAWAVL